MLELVIRMVGIPNILVEKTFVPYFLWISGCIFMYTLIYLEPHYCNCAIIPWACAYLLLPPQ
jgi:hypothetical protein